MPAEIDRHRVQQLVDGGAQLVEVLPSEEYAQEHLPGALSLPLEILSRQTAEQLLRRERPIVTYCQDVQ